ncbi:MAG TPA: aminodeoxychorismate/anthranilate synthase component II [Pirellulaceae bacterium]|jgi:anthranilate synthase/aminodeoxychorismate synthase-like glutamine amidotransferase
MLILIDNYDSFVHNLARYFQRLGQETLVVRNDAIAAAEVIERQPEAIILSPGPCTPAEAGCSLDVARLAAGKIPLLGVCLGHQAIGAAFGAEIVRAQEPMHGRASCITHDGRDLFVDLPNPLMVGRYHSLVVGEATLPPDLNITARSEDGTIMAFAHREWPVFGVQFHPESILTEQGYLLLANFLRLAGIKSGGKSPLSEDERPIAAAAATVPAGPVTF